MNFLGQIFRQKMFGQMKYLLEINGFTGPDRLPGFWQLMQYGMFEYIADILQVKLTHGLQTGPWP